MRSVLRLCPQCHKASHVAESSWFSVCPHCGYELCEQMERRLCPRAVRQHPGILRHNDAWYYSYTLDLSKTGVKVIYSGDALHTGSVLDFRVESLNLEKKAKVVWSVQKTTDTVHAGLQFL